MTADPATNTIPKERIAEAYRYAEQKRAQNPDRAGIAGVVWENRGPFAVSGRTRAILYDAADASNNTVFAGGVGGGIWRTTNFQSTNPTWTPINDLLENLAITTIYQDPNDTDILYVGTGEGWFNFDAIRGLGIFKSTDGGASFSLLPSTSGFRFVQDILTDNNGALYAATDVGVQRSTDGGATWTVVLDNTTGAATGSTTPNHKFAGDLKRSPNGDLWVAFGRIYSDAYLYKSPHGTTVGSAGTWERQNPAMTGQRCELAIAPSNPDVVYALVQDLGGFNASTYHVTTDGGTSWTQLLAPTFCDQGTTTNFTRGQAWYDLVITVHPTTPTIAFFGGVDAIRAVNATTVPVYTQITSWTGGNFCPTLNQDQYVHADHHVILFEPGSSDRVVWASDGGISYTTDVNANLPVFTLKNSGYNVTQFYSCAIENEFGAIGFIAGAQDNGTQRFTSAGVNNTTTISGGDGAFCHVDQDNADVQVSSFTNNNYRVTNNRWGSSSGAGNSNTGRFINPTDLDSDANILYGAASTGEYFRISGVGTSNSSTTVSVGAFGSYQVSAVNASSITANRVFMAVNSSSNFPNSKIFRLGDAHISPTATSIDPNGNLPTSGYISCIELEPGNDDHIVVTFSNYGVNSVWETTNGGSSWISVEGDLPDMPIRWAMFAPGNSDQMLLATELGIWSTDDLNGNNTDWDPTNGGLANVRTDMLQTRSIDNLVIAATHGRGLYSTASFPPLLIVVFDNEVLSVVEDESSGKVGCLGYVDLEVPVTVNAPVDGSVQVTVSGGTATAGDDFQLMNSTLNFTSGGATTRSATIRIFDDAIVEGDETVILQLTNPNGLELSDPTVTTITIGDNEVFPENGLSSTIIWSEDFSDAGNFAANWSITDSEGVNAWDRDDQCTYAIDGFSAYIKNGTSCGYINTSSVDYLDRTVNATDLQNITVSFDWQCAGDVEGGIDYDYGTLQYSTDGITYTEAARFLGANTVQQATVDLPPAVDNTTFTLRFQWNNDNFINFSPPFSIDNIVVTGESPFKAQETIDSRTVELGPNQTIIIYGTNTSSGAIAKIENLSAHDYGCTTVAVETTGTGAVQTYNPNYDFTAKSISISPTNDNPNGQYTVTLYYSETEITGWETATGDSRNDMTMFKASVPVASAGPGNSQSVATTRTAFNDIISFTSSFGGGFSHFAMSNFPVTALPAELLDFSGKFNPVSGANELTWQTATELAVETFEVERSEDGRSFVQMETVRAVGTSSTLQSYDFADHNIRSGIYYYRLKMVDVDSSFDYSEVITLEARSEGVASFEVFPNPTAGQVRLYFDQRPEQAVSVELFDPSGRAVAILHDGMMNTDRLDFHLDRLGLSRGIYLIRVRTERASTSRRIVFR